MRAHCLQHVAFEGLGSIGPWLGAAGLEWSSTKLYESARFPDHHAIDFLIIMGGPMSVHDERAFPWLVPEKQFIRKTIDSGKPVLGICLGAQLIAQVCGARVYQNAEKEIGWFPVEGVPSRDTARFAFPASTSVFHWHGETFDLPDGAVHLARSDGCVNQAFQLGPSVLGLQFHLETTPASALELIAHGRHELMPSTYVQSEQEILAAPPECYNTINAMMDRALSWLAG